MNKVFRLALFLVCLLVFPVLESVCQQLELESPEGFRQCVGESRFTLTIINKSDQTAIEPGSYRIDWGDGSIDENVEFAGQLFHTYENLGVFTLTFSAKAKGSSSYLPAITKKVVNEIAQPAIGIKIAAGGIQCVGSSVEFDVLNWEENTTNTSYVIDFADRVQQSYTGEELEKTGGKISHLYKQSHCELGYPDGITIKITADNGCASRSANIENIYIVIPPKLDFDLPSEECTENQITPQNTTPADGDAACKKPSFSWLVDGKPVAFPLVFHETGTYEVTLNATKGSECSKATLTKNITIIRRVEAIAEPLQAAICEGETVALKGSGSTGDKKKYSWRVVSGGSGNVSFSPNASVADPAVTFTRHGTYRLRLTVDNGCSSDDADVEVVVKKNPEIVEFKPLPSLCPGDRLRLDSYITYNWTWSGNPRTPTWELEGPKVGDEFLLNSEQAEFPSLRFTNPGKYTLRVKLNSAGCPDGAKLEAEQEIIVRDSAIRGEITTSGLDVCENAEIVFTDNLSGVDLKTEWSAVNADGAPANCTKIPGNNGKTMTFSFDRYGDYKIVAEVTAACKSERREFNVKVRRAPEVYFTAFPAVVCPETPFSPADYIDYRPNGNDDRVTFTWEVTGGEEAALLEGENSRQPKVTFPKYGDYVIHLKISNPTSCVSPSLDIRQNLKVSNPKMDLDIKPDKSTICLGERVTFQNNSSVAVEPEYYWGVSPDSYQFVPAGGETSKAPVIEFTKSGIYNVTGVVNGVCRPETLPFTIVVRQDPEVTLAAIPAMCPGKLELTDQLVHYSWNDGWKSGAESTRRVVWKLVSKPDGADCTPPESLEWNAFLPQLDLNTPGDYVLQVEVKSDAGCSAQNPMVSQKVTVYDPALYIDIKPELNADVVQLPGTNEYQVVEGKPLTFINKSRGVGLTYKWSVEPGGQVLISDAEAAAPSVTFGKYGVYKVRVDIEGTCNSDFREFTVVVKGIPKFDFKPIANRCDNWEEIDLRDYLTCDSSGSTEIVCNWTISLVTGDPATGYVITEGTTSDLFYKIRFEKNGRYVLTLKAQAEYGGVQTVTGEVNVLRSSVVTKAELLETEGCTTDGLEVVALNQSQGDSVTYTWSVTPVAGRDLLSAADNRLIAEIKEAGDYRVVLKAANICMEDSAVYQVHAYSKPEVAVIGGTDLGTVCENGYVFLGQEHVGEIQVNNDPLNFVRWEISPEGATLANGKDWEDERPDFKFAGGKNYVITGQFKNRCKDTVSVHYTVAVDRFVPVQLMPDTVVCAHTEAFLLRAEPHGGEWSCSDANAVAEKTGKDYYFNPYRDEYGEYELTYVRGNGSCLASANMKVTVNKLPVVEAGIDRSACLNDSPLDLEGVLPLDGEWKGTGVRDNRFFPEENGDGVFRLEYWYTDASTGCPNLDTIRMTVFPLPDPAFKASYQQCSVTDSLYVPLELGKGNHFKWDFGNGDVFETEDAPAVYQYAEVGEYEVVLTVTSKDGCTVTGAPYPVKVLGVPPPALFTLTDTAGCGPFTTQPQVDLSHFAGEYYNLQYAWDFGNGEKSTRPQPEAQTYQARLFDTVYRITFRVYNVCGAEEATADVGVWSGAVARFAMNPEEEGCTPAEVLFMNKSTGSHNQYTWEFGDGQSSEEIDPVHVFTTTTSLSVFTIKLTAKNRCTSGGTSFERQLKVKPNTLLAGFTKSKRYVCAGDSVCFENNSADRDPNGTLNYSWDFGDGQLATVWDTCHVYAEPGAYRVTLKVDNGCSRREFSDSVFVDAVPVLQLASDAALCEDVELTLKVSSDQPLKNVVWNFGDGTKPEQGALQMKHAFEEPGLYTVRVRGEGNQIPSCPGEVTKTIEVWSNPRVEIAPLDTMTCPPFLYNPRVSATSYDYFKWDYGDGTPLTSEMEHLYENDTNFIRTFNLTAYVENNYGCREEHHGLIRIYNGPKAGIGKDIKYGRPEKVRFINLSKDFSQCTWYLPGGSVVNSPDDQEVTFEREDVYPVSLVVLNEYGCRDSLHIDHRSYEGGLYFPNTFIPHSVNARVSRFNGVGMGLKEYHLEIFDQYGNKIWETKELEGGMPAGGWDGRDSKGKLYPQGVYIWRAKAIFFSEDVWTGENNRSGQRQTTQGTVLLLKE